MFVSSTIDIDKLYKVSLNVTMLFIDIKCFHSVTRYWYTPKGIISNTTASGCG